MPDCYWVQCLGFERTYETFQKRVEHGYCVKNDHLAMMFSGNG